MENPVETSMQGNVLDDAALNPVQEQQAEPLSPLNEAIENQPSADQQPAQKEPGYVRKRIDAAVAKALQEQETRLRAEFAATLAPIRDSMMQREADELVAAGEFKSKERALEYVKLKNGASVSAAPAAQPSQPQRDEQGRFAPKTEQQPDPVVKARADLLAAQAKRIETTQNLDVIQAFNGDPEVQQKVLSGEWDFYDVADYMRQGRIPAPMRSPNGVSTGSRTIASMTDAQFDQLNQNLAAGKIYDAR